MKKMLLAVILLLASVFGYSSIWEQLGPTAGFSGEIGAWIDFGFLDGSKPIIIYSDRTNQFKTTMVYFTNTTSTNAATTIQYGFSANIANYISLAMNPSNNTVWIVFSDRYRTFKGSLWSFTNSGTPFAVSNSFTSNIGNEFKIAVDNTTNIVVLFQDRANRNKASAMNFDGAIFTYLGTPGFSSNYATEISEIAIDTNNHKWVAFKEYGLGNVVSLYKYTNAGNWFRVLSTDNRSSQPTLATYKGNIYLALRKDTDMKVYTYKYTNAGPLYIFRTNTAISSVKADFPSLDIGTNGVFLAYRDAPIGNKLAIRKYDFNCTITNYNTNVNTTTNTLGELSLFTNTFADTNIWTIAEEFTNSNVNTLISNVYTGLLVSNYVILAEGFFTNALSFNGAFYPMTRIASNDGLGLTNVWTITNVGPALTNYIFDITNVLSVGATEATNYWINAAGVPESSGFAVANTNSTTEDTNINTFTWTFTNVYTNDSWYTNITINFFPYDITNLNPSTNLAVSNYFTNTYILTHTNTWLYATNWAFDDNDVLTVIWTNSITNIITNTLISNTGIQTITNVNSTNTWPIDTNIIIFTNVYVDNAPVATNIWENTNISINWFTNLGIVTNLIVLPNVYTNALLIEPVTNLWTNQNLWSIIGLATNLNTYNGFRVGSIKLKATSLSNVPVIMFQDMINKKLKMIRFR